MNSKLIYGAALASICIIHATEYQTNEKTEETVQRLTQHLEKLQSIYHELEAIETDISAYETENAPSRFCDFSSTMSTGRETVDIMLQSTQNFLSAAKDYIAGFINYLLSLPGSVIYSKPEPLHECCGHHN